MEAPVKEPRVRFIHNRTTQDKIIAHVLPGDYRVTRDFKIPPWLILCGCSDVSHDPRKQMNGGVTATGVFSAWQDSQMTLTVKVWHDGTDLDVGAKLYVARL